ncbi:diaminopimelate decarboxylase [Desulfovibrio sp. OttesenSCG-928-A18]|nr:diaminopimelate decarboxylase [Desulfovibrio sp. OttesenSCG-928-A18]
MYPSRTAYSDSLNFFGDQSPGELVARFGSPLYVYNEAVLRRRCRDMKNLARVPGFVACYSTKANGNPSLLRIIREEGLIADAMSPGEMLMLRLAGFSREQICYVSNNVSARELELASVEAAHVSVDSLSQLESFGRLRPGLSVMLRVNPGIGAGHHAKVVTAGKDTKFGISPDDFAQMRDILRRHDLRLVGINQHVGSLFMDAAPFLEAAAWLLDTARDFPGIRLIDFGGGFGIPYRKYEGEKPLDLEELGAKFTALLAGYRKETGYDGQFIIEPGRYVTAECAILLGTVHAVKNNGPTRYVGTDLGFTILARPMMYDSFHDVELYPADDTRRPNMVQTVVGNICESGDILAKDRELPEAREGDLVGVLDAGAYGMAMSSNYNQRLRPAEVLVGGDAQARLIRRRDSLEDLQAVYPDHAPDPSAEA